MRIFWSGEQTAAGPSKRRMALRYITLAREDHWVKSAIFAR
jgi:hypothetical protein